MQGAATASRANPKSAPLTPEMAKMGLGGIQHQPDIFGEIRHPRAADPLGNHVVQDPGFADLDMTAFDEEVEDPAAMFHNPLVSPTKPKKKRKPEGEGSGAKKKKKKRKRKMHPAVKESLDKSTLTLFTIGALTLMIFGFFFFTAETDAAAMMQGEDEEFVEEVAMSMKLIPGCGMALGGIFCMLGLGVQLFPITCSMLALILYVSIDLFLMLMFPFALFDMWGWMIRIVIIGALGKGFMDALNARWFEQAQREREAARGEVF